MISLVQLGLALHGAACAASDNPPQAILSVGSPRVVIEVPTASDRAEVLVTDVQNAEGAPITIIVTDNGRPQRSDRFSLYPPDAPGIFPIRIGIEATSMELRMLTGIAIAEPGPSLHIAVRFRPLQQTNKAGPYRPCGE